MLELDATFIVPDMVVRFKADDTTGTIMELRDTRTGKSEIRAVTGEAAAAIMALLWAGDFKNESLNHALYEIAEVGVKGLEGNMRPIP